MFKKKQNYLNHSQRLHKTKQFELLMLIDKCTQIPKDDKLLIRNKIKQQNFEIIYALSIYKKSNDLSDLQIKLRKLITNYKNHKKLQNLELFKQIKKVSTIVQSVPTSHRTSYSKKNVDKNKNNSNQKIPIFLKKSQLQKKLMKFCEDEDLDSSIHKFEDGIYSEQFVRSPHYTDNASKNLNETTLFKANQLQCLRDPYQSRRLSLMPLRQSMKDKDDKNLVQRYRKSQQKKNRRSSSAVNENVNLNEEVTFNTVLKKNPRKFHQEYTKHQIPLKLPLQEILLKNNENSENLERYDDIPKPKYGQFYKRLKMELGMK